MNSLEQRLASLEKSNRRWRSCVLLVALAAVGVAAAKPSTGVSDLIRTRRLEIVTETGDVRISAGGEAGGALAIYDSDGKRVFGISASAGGGNLDVLDASHGAKTFITGTGVRVAKDGKRESDTGAVLGCSEDVAGLVSVHHGGLVAVCNSNDNIVVSIAPGKDGSGVITANDRDGKFKRSLSGK